jgi:hypothetical protein
MKYAPLIIKKLADLLVGNNTVNKLSGKDLVDLFNEFGFNDDYIYPNVGIATADLGNGLSRTDYARKRLRILNDKEQVDVALSLYLDGCSDRRLAEETLNTILGKAPVVTGADIKGSASFQPHSQFDDIKPGVPTVFISYSWDDQDHKKWAKQLADDLRTKYNICSLIDQYNSAGVNLVEFMNKGIRVADRVLMIGTPIYKQRSESGIGTGGKYEEVIVTTEIYKNTDTIKFIPLLRRGDSFDDSFINIVSVLNGYDFRDDSKYEDKLQELADELYGRTNIIPALAGGSSESTIIPAAYKGERWLYELMNHFSFFLMDGYFERMPCRFDMRVMIMFDTWNAIINSSVYQIKDAQLKKHIDEFFIAWRDICELGWRYFSDSNNGTDYVFYGAEFDFFKDTEHENAFHKLTGMLGPLYVKYKAFVAYLDSQYPDIDREKVSVDFVNNLK